MRKRIEEIITRMKYIDVPRLSAYLIFPAVYRPTRQIISLTSAWLILILFLSFRPTFMHISGQIFEFVFGFY
jgi:hypothetical protein